MKEHSLDIDCLSDAWHHCSNYQIGKLYNCKNTETIPDGILPMSRPNKK